MIRNVALVCLLLIAANTYAEEERLPRSAAETIIRIIPTASFTEGYLYESGDLDQDGIKDVVVMVPETDEYMSDERLVVLKGKADGDYELMVKSPPQPSLRGTHATRILYIKNNSLFVGVGGSSDNDSGQREEFQFKYKNGCLCLIGFRLLRMKNQEPDDREISVNYVTGQKVEWRKVGKRRSEVKSQKLLAPLATLEQFTWSAPMEDYKWTINADLTIRKVPDFY